MNDAIIAHHEDANTVPSRSARSRHPLAASIKSAFAKHFRGITNRTDQEL